MNEQTHVEIHSGILKCECGAETLLADRSEVYGGTLFGPICSKPNQRCPKCRKVWFVPATVDCTKGDTVRRAGP